MKRTSLTVMALCATLLWVGAAQAKLTATQTCQQSKLTAQGALEVCLAQNSANILLGKPDASTTCLANFNAALVKADATALKAGAACRYVANGNGTVSDLNTGLMWEQKSAAGTGDVHDVNNTYTWSTGDNLADGTAFSSFLATLNNGASHDGGVSTPITGCFASHCDWRLPSIVELQGIVNTSDSPTIDPIFGPTQSNFYQSATSGDGINQEGAWIVLFVTGGLNFGNKTSPFFYVRAVRSGL